jgi:hypothetical protein
MKKFAPAIVLTTILIIVAKIFFSVDDYPEKVLDIVEHWFFVWLKGGGIALVVVVIIFLINKKFTDESTMSKIGLLIMPFLIPSLLYVCFGYNLWIIICGAVAGIVIGYYAYIIDDHLLEAWEMRHIVLPLVFGVGFGASCIIAALTENWQDENIYVHEHATCNELIVERYTSHTTSSGKTTTTTYSWDTYKTYYFFKRGEQYMVPVEDRDYSLGTGALGKRDRIRNEYHKWIGGEKISRVGTNIGYKWVYLTDTGLVYKTNTVYEVEENFFGQALKSGKQKSITIPPMISTEHQLPTDDDVPGLFSMSFDFFKIMATNPDFSLLRWIYILIYIPFIVGAIFSPEMRIALFIFFISSTIIILIILGVLAGKSGRSLEDFIPRFRGYGGGSFGGAGASGRW